MKTTEDQLHEMLASVEALEAQCDVLRLALFTVVGEVRGVHGDPSLPVVACVSASGNLRHHVSHRPAPSDPRRLLVTLADARAAVRAATA